MNRDGPIRLRPHHGLCIQHFAGKGYSLAFVENMRLVIAYLRQNPEQPIVLQTAVDILCEACPHSRDGVCEMDQKVRGFDERCLSICGFQEGQRLTWEEYERTVTDAIIRSAKLPQVCMDCGWLSLCERAQRIVLERLL